MVDEDNFKNILSLPARFIDLTYQKTFNNSILLKDGIAKDISSGETAGISIRVLDKGWGFAVTNNMDDALDGAKRALKAAGRGKKIDFDVKDPIVDNVSTKFKVDPEKVSMEEKINLLHNGERAIKDFKEVISSSYSYSDMKKEMLYMSSEGSNIRSVHTQVSLYSSVFAKKEGQIQIGQERLGATGGFEVVRDIEGISRESALKAIRLLKAKAPPSGEFKVVMDPKLTGVFIHEALGHAVEADHIIQGESILEGRLGERLAPSGVTIYDDSTLEGSFGFYHYDSEGQRGQKTVLVDRGILNSFIQSRETASKLGQEITGNCRAQNYASPPIVRMSNTYMATGDSSLEEMIEDIDYGVYMLGSKGGEVDTIRGIFQFSAEEGYLIENGKMTRSLRDVALSGETLNILNMIDSVGKDFDLSLGHCGKSSQMVPVGDGGPHVRTRATVGGSG